MQDAIVTLQDVSFASVASNLAIAAVTGQAVENPAVAVPNSCRRRRCLEDCMALISRFRIYTGYLTLTVMFVFTGAAVQAAPAPVQLCDQLAQPLQADMLGATTLVKGVDFNQIKAVEAQAACESARESWPDEARFPAFEARAAEKRGDFGEAVRLTRLAADKKYAPAQNYLGDIYKQGGYGLSKDEREAVVWYRRASEQGFALAETNLALAYEDGLGGLVRDDCEAVRLLKLAADQGEPVAQNGLGLMYARGRGGLPRDEREAARWARLSADQGYPIAQTNLGFLYFNGLGGLATDEREAVRLWRLAADQGNPVAQTYLGTAYLNGQGSLSRDPTEAVRLYRLAAAQGYVPAQESLSRLGQ